MHLPRNASGLSLRANSIHSLKLESVGSTRTLSNNSYCTPALSRASTAFITGGKTAWNIFKLQYCNKILFQYSMYYELFHKINISPQAEVLN